jgi:hypothetical protein
VFEHPSEPFAFMQQLQARFAGVREPLQKYWQTKHKNAIPTSNIRRHLKKMDISVFFFERC